MAFGSLLKNLAPRFANATPLFSHLVRSPPVLLRKQYIFGAILVSLIGLLRHCLLRI